MPISFNQVGVISGVNGGPSVLSGPTSLAFGPDGRLYVSEQNGSINAFTISIENGEYIATAHEELTLPGGGGVVKSLQNHFDDGTDASAFTNRQVTGLLVTGTATEPVLYISSSDPRIASNGEVNLDTNSGVITKVSWNSTTNEWETIDIIRGLPRSEENHANNGMVLSPDGTKLYITVGGNTNNGAPSSFFSYTAEYVLSGTVLEADLLAIEALPTQVDANGGQGGTPRNYKYDLPTLDDPNTPNGAPGSREDANGLDIDGPWGGNDGLNMAILPADAPLRVFADGFRNHYDLALTPDGKLYTVDNGSNSGLGANPNTEAGDVDGDGVVGEAINTPNQGGSGDPEPLFLIEEGGYYGHPNPTISNQNQAWTVYNDNGTPDTSLSVNSVPDISALVPTSVQIADGFLIDPSKYAGLENLDPTVAADLAQINARLFDSGIRDKRNGPDSNAIITVGSSTNGIVSYDSGGAAFDGVLDGKLFVTQFNDNVTLLNLNANGDDVTAVLEEGPDGIFGTADDTIQAGGEDGILEIANNALGVPLANPLDVTVGPGGTLWVAEIGGGEVTVLAPSGVFIPGDTDSDNDGILNVDDPFLRDPNNGTSLTIVPGQTYLWDFNTSTPLPGGPDGFGGGLTGVLIDGVTDFEQFFQAPSSLPDQEINLDNVKFVTAAGGGTTVIEEVSPGDPSNANSGEFLFHTGAQLGSNVGTALIKWSMFNPVGEAEFDGPSQQIGAYIGTGDQFDYLKVAAVKTATGSAIQVLLENGDSVDAQSYLINTGVFDAASIPANAKIFIELLIDVINETATPTVTYETTSGLVSVPGLTAINLAGTNVLTAIQGNNQVQGQDSGLAVGLFSSNTGQGSSETERFQAIFDDIEISATEALLPPNAENDDAFTSVNTVLTIPVADLLANDSDPNPADTLTVSGVSNALNGTAVLVDNGTPSDASDDFVLFTPALDFEGEATFDYTITDGSETDTASVSVTVADKVVIYRVNAGGQEVAALVSDPVQIAWAANPDPGAQSGPGFSNNTGNISTHSIANQNDPGARDASLPDYVPYLVFNQERWDPSGNPELLWNFDVTPGATYEVNLFLRNGFGGTSGAGTRIFDIEIEGVESFSDVDLSGTYGHQVAAKLSQTLVVADDSLDIEFLHQTENPLINAIEIIQVGGEIQPPSPIVNIVNGDPIINEDGGEVFISLTTNFTVPSGETVDVNFTIEPIGNTTPGSGGDYEYTSASATFGGGVYTDTKSIAGGSSDLQIPITIINDEITEATEAFKLTILSVSPNATLGANSEATVTILDDDTVVNPGDVLFRINAGGPQVTATDGGPDWAADQAAVDAFGSAATGTPSPFLVDRNIPGDDLTYGFVASAPSEAGINSTGNPDALFTTERYSTLETPNGLGYAFNVANGDYTVNLYFDEIFFAATNERVFDVEIENTLVLDDFDTFAAFGNNTGLQSFTTTVSDTQLNLEFLKGAVNNPHVSAIEIIAAAGSESDTFNNVPVAGNDFSNDNTNPNDVTLGLGANTLVAGQEPGDNDYVTIEVQAGQQLISANLTAYEGGTNATFLGIETGDTFTSEDDLTNNGAPLEGGTLYDEIAIGTDLLPLLASTAVEGNGAPTTGLSLPLGPGLYTFWFGQNGTPASKSTLEFTTAAIPEVNLSVTPTEGIETAGTVITVTATASEAVIGNQTVEVSLAGTDVTAADFVEPIPTQLTIPNGQTEASFTLTIADDGVVELDETATFAIANPSSGLLLGATTAGDVVISDDAPTVNPGDVLLRINAGGAEVAATDAGPNWTADQSAVTANGSAALGTPSDFLVERNLNGDDVTYGFVGGAPSEPGVNNTGNPNTLFTTERFSALANPNNLGYAFNIGNGDYTVNLYFDELFFAAAGQRVFDVEIENTLVLDDFDTFANFGNDTGLQSFTTTVNDGQLNLEFIKGAVNNPHVAAIEIVAAEMAVPEVNLSVTPLEGNETDGTLITITATASAAVTGNQTVEVSLSGTDVTATDFVEAIPTQLTILDGQTEASFTLTIANDGIVEVPETATFAIANPSSGLTLGTNTTGNVVISDDLPPVIPNVNLSVTPSEGNETDGTIITITATASEAVVGAQTVDVSLSGTGVTAADFVEAIPTQLTILDGATEASVTLTIANDGIVEGAETATFAIANPSSGLTLGTATTGEVVITDEPSVLPSDFALNGDLDNDGQLNSVDNDIDGDGTPNLDDRTAYDDGAAGIPTFTDTNPIVIDFSGLPDGSTPFEGGFTGLAQTANNSAELDYSTNTAEGGTVPAEVVNGRLVIETTNDDTVNADSGFTFLANNEGQSFILEGLFDNPVFNGVAPPNFSQYGLILSLTGADGVTGADFIKLTTGNPGGGLELSGSNNYGSVPKPSYPAPFDSTSYAQVKLNLEGTVENNQVSIQGTAEYLDENDVVLFTLSTSALSVPNTTPLYDALTDSAGAPTAAFGLTSTDVGGGGAFTFGVESLSLSRPDEVIVEPPGPDFGLELLAGLDATDGIATGGVYAPGQVGAAELDVLSTNNNIQKSNFGADSFQVTNTGDKKIAAVFIDFRNSVFGDSVIDLDGSGGDNVAKPFAVNTNGSTGAFFDANDSNVYFIPGTPPLENTTGTGQPSTGGFRGLLLKAGNTTNGFEPGETVGFSGDMDPNSIAGLLKNGVDSGAIVNFDVGGISGAEIAGSRFFVLFDDSTTASGVLGNSGTQAGSIGRAIEGQNEVPVSVTVNGGSGVYGGTEPTIVVNGPANQTVLITLSKGIQPVTNDTDGYQALVEARLADSQPEFPVNNAFDIQTITVTIGQNGTVLVPSGSFDYNETDSGVQFAGDDVAPIVISAVAIDTEDFAIGQVARDYLTNPTQTPVNGSIPVVNLSVTPTAGNETDGTVITVTATASAAVNGNQSIDFALSGTDVTAADFVETVPSQLTILDGQTEASFTLTIANDAVVEAAETATFSITNPSTGVVLGATTTGEVVITDEPSVVIPEVNLSVSPNQGNEVEGTSITVTITASEAVTGDQTLDFNLSGTGVTSSDFVEAIPTQITIPNGQTEASFTLTIANDAVAEAAETATFSIASPSAGVVLGATTTGNVVITDGDEPGSAGYFEPSINGNNFFYKIQIEDSAAINGGTDPEGKWNYVDAPDSAGRQDGFQGSGYFLYGSNTNTSLNQVVSDEILEFEIDVPESLVGRSMAFRIRASRDGTAASDQQNDAWFNVIRQDGTGSIDEFLTNSSNEAEPTSGGFIKIFGGPNNGTWGYAATVDGQPNNFGARLEFEEAGRYILQVAGRSQGFHIDWIELFKVGSAPATDAENSVFVTVGPPIPEVSIAATQDGAEEGEIAGLFTVNLSESVNSDTVISYSVTGTATSGDDFTPLSGQVTILANQQSATITVPVIDDIDFEVDETVTVTLDAITAGDPTVVLGSNAATLTIVENEVANELTIAATTPVASEPLTDGQFTVSLVNATTTDTVISYSVTGTATPDADYTALTGEVTILANQTSAIIDVSVLEDSLVEGTEDVIVTLNGITSGDPEIVLGTDTDATVIINDDDQPLAALTIEAESSTNVTGYRVENDGDASGGSMLSFSGGASNETGSATYTFTGATGFYNVVLGAFDESDGAPAATLEVAVGANSIGTVVLDQDPGGNAATSSTKVERSVAQVLITNGETITVTGVESGGEHARFDFIRFEPAGPPIPQVSITATQDGAEEGEVAGLFTVNLSEAVNSDTVISYSVTGTATSGDDFTSLSGQVTILANQQSATITVPVIDDIDFEVDETVTVTLDTITAGDPTVVLGSNAATLTIVENEVANELTIAATTPVASEPLTDGQFTVSLVNATTTDTVISYSVTGTATPDADYTALTGEVTILANQTSAIIDVSVLEDSLVEGAEDVIVTLNGVTSGDPEIVLGTDTDATVIINDDDQPLAALTIEAESSTNVTGYRVENDGDASGGSMLSFSKGASNETGSATYTFTGATGFYNVVLGAFDENDGAPAATLEVAVGANSIGTVVLDQDPGGNAATSSTKVERSVAQVLITNGETITVTGVESGGEHARFDFIRFEPAGPPIPQVSITATQDGAEEGEVAGLFTVNLSEAVNSDTVISYSVTGTATSGDDFTALSGQVTILANQQSATITVPVIDDIDFEVDETVTVTLDAITAGDPTVVLGSNTATLTIVENEVANELNIVTTQDGAEAGEVPGLFTVNLAQTVNTDTVISYTVAGTATAGDDYTPLNGTVTILANQQSATIPVPVIDDTDFETDETVTVTLDAITAGDPAVVLGSDTATLTIVENEVVNEVNIAATTPVASEPMTDGQFTVSLESQTTTDTVISYTATGSATAGVDYSTLSGEVTILANDTSATIDVSVLEDTLVEGAEDVIVTLNEITAGAPSVFLGTSTDATVTINDDDLPAVPIRVEAEDANTVSGEYIDGIEGIVGASGGSVLSFRRGAANESGSASFVFGDTGNALNGTYSIVIGTYDENDGLASFSVDFTDFETGVTTQGIGNLVLDDNLGSGAANAQTAVAPVVVSGLQLTMGDIITVNGQEEGKEHARFDYLEIVPTI